MPVIFDDPDMQEIFEGFLVETQELLDLLQQDLMTMETQPDDSDLINSIFRNFHTIKGTSSFMGFDEITQITHKAEDLLNKLRKNELVVTEETVDVLLEVQDIIQKLLDNIVDDNKETFDYSKTENDLLLLNAAKSVNDKVDPSKLQEKAENTTDTTESTESNLETSDNVDNPLDTVLDGDSFANHDGDFTDEELELLQQAFQQVNAEIHSDADKAAKPKEEEIQEPIQKVAEPPKKPKIEPKPDTKKTTGKKSQKNSETIRIDVDRIETLMDLSGELVLGRNRLSQISTALDNDKTNFELFTDLLESTQQIDFLTSEIQSAVMKMRMVPIAKLFQKAPRMIRDLSKEFNKKIKLEITGEETEIDRSIIEELNDPLVHMIRNSCDHGIETPEIRLKKGKPAQGIIKLDADQEGNNIVIKISDDGAGMDPDFLKGKAIEKGVITTDQAAQMSNREAFQLIFAPGFSTAKVVTSVSGRGVGMDVVRTHIEKLKGMIEIDSELGKGSVFIIKLPLTLAIIQGLLVKVGKEIFAVPLSSVVEVVSLDQENVYFINQQEVIRIRQEVLPITRLENALDLSEFEGHDKMQYVVNVGVGVQYLGLVVDELIGQEEIVIKSLGKYLGNIKGIAGSTILGDGKPIMILDISQLVKIIYNQNNLNGSNF